jgi:hypothetical protein
VTTPNIGLIELANGQANYLNVNDSFAVIDAILQTRPISKTLTAAPGSPVDGDVHIMQSAWAGITTFSGAASAAGDIAVYRSSIGVFKAIRPKEGWRVEVAADDTEYRFNGTTWGALAGAATQCIPVACSDETTALTAGASKVTFRMPYAFTLTGVRASLTTAQASGSIITVDINESGTTILSTKLTIDNTEKTSTTAAAAPVISDTALADDAEITIDIDQIGDGTAKGLKVYLIGSPV